MNVVNGLRWRAAHYVSPYRPLYRQPLASIRRAVSNRRTATTGIAYVYAEPLNAGDYASHLGVRSLAGLPGVELFCSRWAVPQMVRALVRRRWDAIFVGGGGLFQKCFEPAWETLLRTTSAPLVVFGVGVNELDGLRRPLRPDLLRAIARRAAALHVRDNATAALLAGHASAPVTVGLCPSLNYLAGHAAAAGRPGRDLLHVVHSSDLQAAGGSPASLRTRLQETARRMGLRYREIDHSGGLNASLLASYRRAAVVVSSRLHGCIFSYALARPVIAIVCDRKTQGFIDTHAPWLPSVGARDAVEALDTERLAGVVSRPQPGPPAAALAANQARMAAVLRELQLSA